MHLKSVLTITGEFTQDVSLLHSVKDARPLLLVVVRVGGRTKACVWIFLQEGKTSVLGRLSHRRLL